MITSRNNREIIEVAKLRKKKNRDQKKLFLIDGSKVLEEAIKSDINIQKIFATRDWINKNESLIKDQVIEEVSIPVIEKLSGVKTTEGVIAVAQKPDYSFSKNDSKYVILENIQDPGNLGTIIRTADAFCYRNIILSDTCVDLFNEKTLRASMGSLFHVNIQISKDLIKTIEELKVQNYTVIGTSLEGTVINLKTLKIPERLAIVLGNEGNGISQDVLSTCTDLLKIPITGQAESLNVSVAAGIFLFIYAQ